MQKGSAYIAQRDGVALEGLFSEETAHTLLEFILFERVCCSSFHYQLEFPPPQTNILLRVTAPPEQVEALQALYR